MIWKPIAVKSNDTTIYVAVLITYLLRPRETVCFADGRGATKHTVFPRSQQISVLLLN
jgi:hypothetical protein